MPREKTLTIRPLTRKDWRAWLREHHDRQQAVWLVFYKQHTGRSSLDWSAAVEEALCYGWIDGKRKALDEERYVQYFCQRKPNGNWSKRNKESVLRLIKSGKMTRAGQAAIAKARENGSWTLLDSVEALIVPEDLDRALSDHPAARAYFEGLSPSSRKTLLYWLVSAR